MTALLVLTMALPAAGALIGWTFTRTYYRAAYGDRYQRGFDDGRAAQIRAYQAARPCTAPWETPRMLPAPARPAPLSDAHSAGEGVTVLGSWYPRAAGPPTYAQLSPEQLGDDPPTSEWARDLIAGIEAWNAEYCADGGPPWHG